MAYRATKSGIAAEAQAKVEAKYDEELARQAMIFLRDYLQNHGDSTEVNTSGDKTSVHATLKDGFILAKVSYIMKGQDPSKVKPQKMPFKQMELIGQFLETCKASGVPDYELFQTVDLFEQQNMAMVITTISVLARKMGAYGPKESDVNKRNFSEEQLKAGNSVIGLQMGSNKGANQSGINMGKGRMIVD